MERYDPFEGRWQSVASMQKPRYVGRCPESVGVGVGITFWNQTVESTVMGSETGVVFEDGRLKIHRVFQ